MINSDGKYAELNFSAYFKFSITFCELSKNIDNFFKNSEIPNFLRLTEVLSNSVATILATDQSENATKPSTGDRLVWHLFNSSMINRWISSEIRAGKSLFIEPELLSSGSSVSKTDRLIFKRFLMVQQLHF